MQWYTKITFNGKPSFVYQQEVPCFTSIHICAPEALLVSMFIHLLLLFWSSILLKRWGKLICINEIIKELLLQLNHRQGLNLSKTFVKPCEHSPRAPTDFHVMGANWKKWSCTFTRIVPSKGSDAACIKVEFHRGSCWILDWLEWIF